MKIFEAPELKTVVFAAKDIITASAENDDDVRKAGLTWIKKDPAER